MKPDALLSFLNALPLGAKWRYELKPAGDTYFIYSWLYQKIGDDLHAFINTGHDLEINRHSSQWHVQEAVRDMSRPGGVVVRFVGAEATDPGSPPKAGGSPRRGRSITRCPYCKRPLEPKEQPHDAN